MSTTLYSNLLHPAFLGYLSIITLLGVILHNNQNLQDDIHHVVDTVPKPGDFADKTVLKILNKMEGRINKLENSVCRCGLGPENEGEKVPVEDERKENQNDKKHQKFQVVTAEEGTITEQVKCAGNAYANIEHTFAANGNSKASA